MSLFFYNIFIWLYLSGAYIAAIWNPKARRWMDGRKNIFDQLESDLKNNSASLIWFHCASLGEFEQGRPLIETLKNQYPDYRILITFFSPSGYEAIKSYKTGEYIYYLPLGTKRTARRFINIVNPALVIWIKYDYWYHYLLELKQRNIPVLLISAIFHKEMTFFKWYGQLHKKMLHCFTHLFVQTVESKNMLAGIGFSRQVSVSGDTRFDRVIEIAEKAGGIPAIESFVGHKHVIVAGSTWQEDEEELDHYANTKTEIKFILVPHEIDETHLQDIEKLFRHCIRYSQLKKNSEKDLNKEKDNVDQAEQTKGNDLDITRTENQPVEIINPEPMEYNTLIVDNIGMLARIYRYATIAYIGGGFGDDGIHNVLEAAVYGKPVIFGPVFDKYREAIDLLEEGAAFTVDNALELEKTLDDLLKDDQLYQESCNAAKNYVFSKKGATAIIMRYIQENRLLTN